MNQANHTRYVILLHKNDQETSLDTIFRHVEHLRKLDAEGTLVLCGPFTDHAGGMVVVNAANKEEAEKIAKADPFVVEGVRTYEVRTWLLACAENNYLS
ncbi:YciI family protein [Bdellovibrio sp. HCB290]|uniref:YciI family protein n=1 Tax=Bdellovibrio sp. HCB290 TaxID=3394356 RepID=UPI0039B53C1D